MRQLGGMDTMFVRAETPSMHLHVVGVLVVAAGTTSGANGGTPAGAGADDVRLRIKARVRERLPLLAPFRWRLVETPGGIGAPRWIEDPAFDIDRHIHLASLPSPGSRSELEQFTGAVASTPLERDRPLWEMHLVDGLADGSIAVVTKLHHAFMDGGAGAEVMASLFDLSPDQESPAPDDDWQPDPVPPPWQLLAAAPGAAMARFSRIPGALLRSATGMSGFLGAMFPTAEGRVPVSTAPRTPFNGSLTPDRIVVLADCSLVDVKKVKSAFGVTVNDVLLAAVTSSLRSELQALEALDSLGDHPLIAAVPVSVRPADLDEEFGNHTSVMMVPLPTNLDDPVERLMAIHEVATQIKEQHRAMGPNLLETWAGLLPPWVISAGSRAMELGSVPNLLPPTFNTVVSNVQGPPIPLYLAGAEVLATYPLGPLVDGVGLNITVFSQLDTIHIGLVTAPDLVAHPEAIAAGLSAAVDELLTCQPAAQPAGASATVGRGPA